MKQRGGCEVCTLKFGVERAFSIAYAVCIYVHGRGTDGIIDVTVALKPPALPLKIMPGSLWFNVVIDISFPDLWSQAGPWISHTW